jgi:hypothetical protein
MKQKITFFAFAAKWVAALASRALPFNTGAAFFVDGGLHMKVL